MASIFATNENNDIFATPGGRLAMLRGLFAVSQHTRHAVEARRGEMIYAKDRGINYIDNVFSGTANLLQFEAEVRAAVSRIPEVTKIDSFSADLDGNTLKYSIGIQTIFGPDIINGNI